MVFSFNHQLKSDLIKTIGSQWFAAAYGATASVLLMFFLARQLGPSSLAVYLYLYVIASLFAIIQDGGYQVLIFREKASPTQAIGLLPGELLSGYYGFLIPVTILGMIFVVISPIPYKAGFVLALLYFAFRCVTNLVSSVLKGQGDFTREAVWRIQVQTFLSVSVLVMVGLTTPTPEKVFWGLLIGQIFLFTTKTGRSNLTRPKLVLPPWRLWKTCLAFIIINAATTIYFKCDLVLLKHMQADLDLVGYYGAAFQVLEGVVLFATPIAHLCFRSLRLDWQDSNLMARKLAKMLVWTVLISLAITLAGFLLAPLAIVVAYGDTYAPAAGLLSILLVALFFLLPNFLLAQGLIALNKEVYFAMAAFFCAVFNLGMNVFLIPLYQATGAAWATVATECLLCLLLGSRFYCWWKKQNNWG